MSDAGEPRERGWWRLSVLGWLAHVGLAAGLFARAAALGAYWGVIFDDFKLKLPLWTGFVHPFAVGLAGPGGPWVMGGLAAFDLAMLLSLAAYDRRLWGWWFWGVAFALILLLPFVEFAYLLPAWKLREAGLL
jgi:hypothetical protein